MFDLTGGIATIVSKVIDKFPDPKQKAEAQLALVKLQQEGRLDEMKTQMSAIIAEATSSDKWTSRARPSFMYVMYAMLLYAIPFSWLYAFNPDVADRMVTGFKLCLSAIPEPLYALFGVGFLGYVGGRSYEKGKGVE